jgi:RHS repeat-associated protein
MKTYEQRLHDSGKGNVMSYDDLYRLTNMKFNVPDPTIENPTTFEKEKAINFDHLHNILSMVENFNGQTKTITTDIPKNSVYSKLNQYASFDQWGLDYDRKGNTAQRGTQQLTYDYRNQLATANDAPSNTQVEMKYDVLGRRIQKAVTIGSQTKIENYYHSGHQVIEVRDGNDQLLRQYIYGNGIDEIIRMDKYEGGTVTSYYYHTDASGSVTAITDTDGNLVERVTYDIYGMPTFWDADGNEISKSSIGNNILFHGREYDAELNLYYFRARYYDPIMGRFLSTDPMGYQDSLNLYQGFYMNPFNFFDPFGLQLSNSESELFEIQNQISGLEQAILAAINNPRTKPEQIVNLITVYKAMASQYGKNPKLIFALLDNLDINRDFLFQTDKSHAKEFFDNIIKEIAIQCAFAIGGEILEGILVARAASFLDDAARAATFSDDIVRAGTVSDDIAKAGSFSDDVVRTGSVSDDIVRTGSKLRQQYVDEVLALKDKIPTLEKAGMTKEEIAKILYSERNALKIKYRKLTPAKRLEEIENRCLNVYGNKLGPTIEQLRAKGKTWEQIIESATRPGGQDLGF